MSRLVENDELDESLTAITGEGVPEDMLSGLKRLSPQSVELVHSVHAINECEDGLRQQWEEIRSSHSCYRSPFFSYDFIHAVSQVGPPVEVAIARCGGKILALLPFVRRRRSDALPVGAGVNDAHGLLASPEYPFSFSQFLAKCKLRSFAFHAAPPDSPDIERYEMGRGRSFLADLTVDPLGYEHFLRQHSSTIDRQGQKSRRLAREVGPLRLEYDCRDPALIDYLIQLKGAQYQRTHTFDILAVSWIKQLLQKLHTYQEPNVRGLLSVFYAGEKPVALHYGLLEGDWLHYWFPVYDEQYSYGSPGTQMFLDIAREATARGVRAIDMGYSEQAYKYKLTNVITEMSYGLVDPSPWRRHLHRRRLRLRQQLKGFWFKDQIKPLVRRILPNLGRDRYQQ
ncbi:MAG: GNAT family N-acetyltransferase [Pirellulaceae bacterium]|nr:GNAT family N-acetyltransferase [Pirellulaceae bacterium]